MNREEKKLISLKVSDATYSADIELINRPIQGEAQNYILVSKSPSSEDSNREQGGKWEKSIPKEIVEKLFDELEHASIPPFRNNGIFGLDGTSYKISFRDFGCSSTYYWWGNAPRGWEPLEKIAETLYSYSGKAGYRSN